MAKVYLRSYGGRDIMDLPPVCMKCGAPATARKSKLFSWHPQWVIVLIIGGLLPYVIVAMLLTRRQRVETPLCNRHRNYWWLPHPLLLFTFIGIMGLGLAATITMGLENDLGKGGSPIGGMLCGMTIFCLLLWILVAVVMNSFRIRPKEITDRYIHMTAVSQDFADAVDEEDERDRRAFDRADDEYERRPRRNRDDDDPRYTR